MIFAMNDKKRYLVSSLDNLGDFLQRIPLIRYLNYEGHDVTVMGCRYIAPLVKRVPEIDHFLEFEDWFQKGSVERLNDLKKMDAVLITRGHDKDFFLLKESYRARVKERIGSKRSLRFWYYFTKNIRAWRFHEMHESEIALKFIGQDRNSCRPFYENLLGKELSNTLRRKPKVIIHPGSHGHGREWQVDAYEELITRMKADFEIVLTGSEKEKERFTSLEGVGVQSLMGKTSLEELLALIESSDGMISSGTGPLHIAAAFNRRAIGLYPLVNGINKARWAPLGKCVSVIEADSICRCCRLRRWIHCKEKCVCMNTITVDCVIDECKKLFF